MSCQGRFCLSMPAITTVVDRTLNEWSEWQMKNLNAIVWLYRGESEKYKALLADYCSEIVSCCRSLAPKLEKMEAMLDGYCKALAPLSRKIADTVLKVNGIEHLIPLNDVLKQYAVELNDAFKAFSAYGDSLEKAEAKEFASIDIRL